MPSCLALVRAEASRAGGDQQKAFGAAPELPTAIEAGYPGVDIVIWNGVVAPAATPRDIVAKLGSEILDISRRADIRQTFDKLGMELTPGDAEQFRIYLQSELAKFAKVVKESGVRID